MVTGWALLALAIASSSGPPRPCRVEEDCSLSGTCAAAVCRCRHAWLGPSCAILNRTRLLANRSAGAIYGYHHNALITSWGGNIVRDDAGDHHLFVAEIGGQNCGLGKWGSHCQTAHAVSVSGPVLGAVRAEGPDAGAQRQPRRLSAARHAGFSSTSTQAPAHRHRPARRTFRQHPLGPGSAAAKTPSTATPAPHTPAAVINRATATIAVFASRYRSWQTALARLGVATTRRPVHRGRPCAMRQTLQELLRYRS